MAEYERQSLKRPTIREIREQYRDEAVQNHSGREGRKGTQTQGQLSYSIKSLAKCGQRLACNLACPPTASPP
jgi:hypothetical protein